MKQATQREPEPSATANAYKEQAGQAAALSPEERERLILEHLPQVRLIARRIHERLPESVSLDDLISTGAVGLISAIDRFDSALNVKLKTYAEYKIRGAILDSLRGLDWAPRQQRKRSKQIERAISVLEQRLHRTPEEDEIATELKLGLDEYHEWLVEIRGLNVGSLESATPDDENGRDLLQYISDDEEAWPSRLLERSELQKLLAEAIGKMPDIEKTVLSLYYYEELTLREISKVIRLHESRISQLKTQAVLRLRSYMEKTLAQPEGSVAMDPKREANQTWLFTKLEERLASVFEAMAGERPSIRQEPLSAALENTNPMWRQDFQGLPGALWISASEPAWTEAAQQVLRAAGLDDPDQATLRSTYTETLGQALSGVAQEITSRLGREVTCETAGEYSAAPASVCWVKMTLVFPNGEVPIEVAAEDRLLDALNVAESLPAAALTASAGAQPGNSKTFDLLLDVELPVSVSFGRARVALKDVIKLTTGSIVELNRSITEPVEVIVNNCVIARGEVVVVEGNFGVRIQEVISRQERLRTLN